MNWNRTCVLLFVACALAHPLRAETTADFSKLQNGNYLTNWSVLGPIAVDDAVSYEQYFETDPLQKVGGEAKLTASAAVKLGDTTVDWRPLGDHVENGVAQLSKALSTDNERATGYAHTWIDSPQPRKFVFAVGSDDAIKVWLNGELVHEQPVRRNFRKDNDFFGVHLKQGRNSLLVRVDKIGSDWRIACRALQGVDLAERLIKFAARGEMDLLQMALEHGADVNSKSKRGFTAYESARRAGFKSIADFLVERGAKTDIPVPTYDEFLSSLLAEEFTDSTPACVMLVGRDGKILMQEAYGQASLEENDKRAATINTKFRIGSISKQFVAAAILKLQEEGKLSVRDKLSKFIADYPHGDDVTLHHLLTHTSGIVSFTSKPEFWQRVEKSVTEEQVIDMFKDDKFEFEPGDRYSYCNSGYFLLGHIVGKVTDSSLEAYLKKTFFDPLGMKNTGVHRSDLKLTDEAKGYAGTGDEFELAMNWDMSWAGGAGAIYSTVGDMFLWNEAIFSNKVLKEETLQQAFSPTTLNDGSKSDYAYGWMLGNYRGLKTISHAGGLNGFLSYLIRYPEIDATVAVLVNASPTGKVGDPNSVERLVAGSVFWEAMKTREVRVADRSVDPATYQDFVGAYDYGAATMQVTTLGKRIFSQLSGQEKHEIFPSGPDNFFWKVVDAQVEFQRDKDGKVIRALHSQNGAIINAARLPDSMKISDEKLQRLVGRYDYKSGIMTVTRDGSQIFAQITGQPKFPIYPESETKFSWKVVDAQVEFVAGEDGKIVKAVHSQGGTTFDAPRVAALVPIKVDAEKLDEVVGTYNLGFLVGKMEITRKDDKMFAKLGRQPKFEIVPVAEDEFAWLDVAATMKFERDEEGKVTRGVFTQAGKSIKAPRVK